MRFQRSLILFLVLVLAIAGISASKTAAQAEKTLIIGLAENTTSLDPARGYEPTGGIILKGVYDTLVTWPADNVDKVIPNLATEWKISDDGKTYTFTLKEGVMFSTGNPMTADDVVFSFNRVKNIKGNPSFLAETIASVAAKDPKTVVLTLTKPDPAILAKIIFPAFSIVDSKTVKAQGGTDAEGADKADKAETWLNQNSAGTGPYVLTKWEKNNQTVLVKNAKYNGKATVAFDQVIVRDIPKAATQKAALEAGDIDIAYDLTSDQSASVKGNSNLKLYEGPSNTVFFLLMNQDKAVGGPMSDPKVQKAVRLALDYQGVLKLAGGAAVTPPSVIPVGFATALGKDKALKQDKEAAKKLMADAGVKDASVELEYADFTYLGVNIGTLAQKVQADLKDIGITVKLKPGDVQTALANYREAKSGFALWFWGPDYIDPLDYVEFLPEGIVGKRANWTDKNASADIKDLRDKLKVAVDPAKRAELFGQMQTWLQENGAFAPFLQPGIQIGYSAKLKGFAYSPQWALDPATFSK